MLRRRVPSSRPPAPRPLPCPSAAATPPSPGTCCFASPKGAAVRLLGTASCGAAASWHRCSDSSVVCSEHFAPVCFDVSSVIQKNLRFSERLRPVAGAVSILRPVASLLKPKGKEEETERAAGEGRKAPGSQAAPGYPRASLLCSPLARQEGFQLHR